MTKITVRYFAQARELAGAKEEQLEISGSSDVRTAVSKIIEIHPRLIEMERLLRVIVNGRMIDDENILLKNGDAVALLPPIAGG